MMPVDIKEYLNNELNWAYLAGFVDADGCISLTRNKKNNSALSLSISNTNKEVLDWICILTKMGVVKKVHYSPSQQCWERHRCRVQWVWKVKNNGMRYILPKIIPYLIVKKRQAILTNEFLAISSRGNYIPINQKVKDRIKRRNEIIDEMKYLNHGGILIGRDV